jgi:hypothetical protein
MLRNATYCGYVSGQRDRTKQIKGLHEAIVPEALCDRVQELRRQRARTLKPGRPSNRYVLPRPGALAKMGRRRSSSVLRRLIVSLPSGRRRWRAGAESHRARLLNLIRRNYGLVAAVALAARGAVIAGDVVSADAGARNVCEARNRADRTAHATKGLRSRPRSALIGNRQCSPPTRVLSPDHEAFVNWFVAYWRCRGSRVFSKRASDEASR